jgi:hypothetical protein
VLDRDNSLRRLEILKVMPTLESSPTSRLIRTGAAGRLVFQDYQLSELDGPLYGIRSAAQYLQGHSYVALDHDCAGQRSDLPKVHSLAACY